MASAERIISLLQAHYRHNEEDFNTVALQIAAAEARAGHLLIANEIKNVVDENRQKKAIKVSFLNNALDDVLMEQRKYYNISDLVVSENIKSKINRIINEYNLQERLKSHGLQNRNKVLFGGPSGTGKTMSASIIAHELYLPLYVVRMDKILTRFMGASSAKLGLVFDVIDEHRGVYLFDEFDAIGVNRDSDNEVGEMRRVLTSFLQFIENVNSNSIVVAATNHLDALDDALFRRFDDIVTFQNPTYEEICVLLDKNLGNRLNESDKHKLATSMDGMSHALICAVCNDAIKESIVSEVHVSLKSLHNIVADRIYTRQKRA